jgi:hypothetical protein
MLDASSFSRAQICKRSRSPEIDSASRCSLAGRYDNSIRRTGKPEFDSLESIPGLRKRTGPPGIDSLESISGLLERAQIRALHLMGKKATIQKKKLPLYSMLIGSILF